MNNIYNWYRFIPLVLVALYYMYFGLFEEHAAYKPFALIAIFLASLPVFVMIFKNNASENRSKRFVLLAMFLAIIIIIGYSIYKTYN